MSIFKRGRTYWYKFNFNGEAIRESTRQTNQHTARQVTGSTPIETIRALEAHADVLTSWLVLWTALVVVGLMMEYGAEFAKWKPRNIAHPRSFVWIWLWGIMGGILVVGGVAGEMSVELASFRVESDLREKNRQNEAWLTNEASDAKTSAKGAAAAVTTARHELEQLSQRALVTEKELEQEHNKRVALATDGVCASYIARKGGSGDS